MATMEFVADSLREPEDGEEEYQGFGDDSEEEDQTMSEAESEQKDETELELERLVFGDNAGFRNELKAFGALKEEALKEEALKEGEYEEQEENDLAGLADEDLFMIDTGDNQSQALLSRPTDTEIGSRREAAWHDSDDERRQVSLLAVPRLRKLRHYEGEDVISGLEYTRRLRQQFEVLHPRPAWADWKANAKKRRHSDGSSPAESATNSSDEEDDDLSVAPLAKLLRSTASLTRSTSRTSSKRLKLRPEVIGIERMKDISPTQPSAITKLSIHPTLPLLLSSGPSSTLYLHHLRPHPTPPDAPNPLITSLHLKHTPLTTTAFSSPSSPSTNLSTSSSADPTPQIYLSSRRRYFHTWSLSTGIITKTTRVLGPSNASSQRTFEILKPSPCGRYIALLGSARKGGGVVNILSASTTHWICAAGLESRKGLADFVWWSDGRGLVLVGRGGEVQEWNVEERRVVGRWQDEGAVGVTCVAMGGRVAGSAAGVLGADRWIAIGSTSGIVNVYDRSGWIEGGGPPMSSKTMTDEKGQVAHPTPTKTLTNLTTPISQLAFSPDGQLLAMASRWKRDALRLVHLPSCTVYRNWPTSKTPLGRISAVALGEIVESEGEGRRGAQEGKVLVLVVGNEAGVLRGWEITG